MPLAGDSIASGYQPFAEPKKGCRFEQKVPYRYSATHEALCTTSAQWVPGLEVLTFGGREGAWCSTTYRASVDTPFGERFGRLLIFRRG